MQGTSLVYLSSPGCISLVLVVAFSLSPWAVLDCPCVCGAWSCWSPWVLLWQSMGQAGHCHPDESFPPDGLWSSQERLPQAAAAVLRGPDPLQSPVPQSHPLFSQQAQPVPVSSLSPHARGAGQRGAEGFRDGINCWAHVFKGVNIGKSVCEPGWQRSCLALLPHSMQHCLCLTPWGRIGESGCCTGRGWEKWNGKTVG